MHMADVSPELRKLKEPAQCAFWRQPDLLSTELKQQFDKLVTLRDEESPIGDVWLEVLRCRECQQLYFFEQYYRNDRGAYHTFIPISDMETAHRLDQLSIYELIEIAPALRDDRHVGGRLWWVGT